MIIRTHRKIPGSIFTLGTKAGKTTQNRMPIGTAAAAQMPRIWAREY
jgi:hypothetical protein